MSLEGRVTLDMLCGKSGNKCGRIIPWMTNWENRGYRSVGSTPNEYLTTGRDGQLWKQKSSKSATGFRGRWRPGTGTIYVWLTSWGLLSDVGGLTGAIFIRYITCAYHRLISGGPDKKGKDWLCNSVRKFGVISCDNMDLLQLFVINTSTGAISWWDNSTCH